MGMNTFVRSWVPRTTHIVGMVVRHGEAFSITEKLTVWEGGGGLSADGPLCLLPLRLRHRLAARAARL